MQSAHCRSDDRRILRELYVLAQDKRATGRMMMSNSATVSLNARASNLQVRRRYSTHCPMRSSVIDADDRIRYVNSGAEDFFQASSATLLRCRLTDLVHTSSPMREAVGQVRAAGGVVTKYAVNVGTPRTGGERSVDLQATIGAGKSVLRHCHAAGTLDGAQD